MSEELCPECLLGTCLVHDYRAIAGAQQRYNAQQRLEAEKAAEALAKKTRRRGKQLKGKQPRTKTGVVSRARPHSRTGG